MRAFKTIMLCSILGLWSGCTPPTDVDASRKKISEDPLPVNTSAIKFASKNIDFGYLVVQTGSEFVDIPLYNISMIDTVLIDTLNFKKGNQYFRFVPDGNGYPIPLLPGQRTTTEKKINLEFYPQTAGEFFDTLYVNGDTTNFVALHGISGIAAQPASNTIDDIDFGYVAIGSSQELPTKITNNDVVDLKLTIENLPPDETGFSIRTLPGEYTIPPGAFKNISIMFTPTQAKQYSEDVRLYLRGATGKLIGTFTARGKGKP